MSRLLRDYALSIAFWELAALVVALRVKWVEPSAHYTDLLLVYSVRHLCVALLTPPLFYLVNRWPITEAPLRRATLYALGIAPFSVAFGVMRWLMLPTFDEITGSFRPRTLMSLEDLTVGALADLMLVYVGIIGVAHAYAYFVRGRRLEIERLQLRQSLAQSELQALRAQLRPHFLFNTLQGISALIDADPPLAQRMLEALASLLRKVLAFGSTDLIPLRQELAVVDAYLSLEQMRMGRRLQVRRQISPEAQNEQVPQLLLQPLVENAIVHGIACAPAGGWLELQAQVEQARLVLVIRNSVGGQPQPGSGVGIDNTRARLRYLYRDDASFSFTILPEGVAEARLSLPAFIAAMAQPPLAVTE
ncbi:MAG: histidine kinase [Proteobacteria bacterium]|nr:histidine kinase [Pseudomonadota bacterium]